YSKSYSEPKIFWELNFNKSLKQEFYWLMTNIRNKDDCILASKPKILTKSVMTEKIFLACEKINLNFKISILNLTSNAILMSSQILIS
ncbi:MAG: hypothetical protein ACO30H_12215, partial [bacterium]